MQNNVRNPMSSLSTNISKPNIHQKLGQLPGKDFSVSEQKLAQKISAKLESLTPEAPIKITSYKYFMLIKIHAK
jgi:hypothetical protein